MQYYLIEWDREEADEPWRLYLELDARGCLRRKVQVYRVGLYEPFEISDALPTDPRQLAGDSGSITPLNRTQFDDLWELAREAPGSFMDMYY